MRPITDKQMSTHVYMAYTDKTAVTEIDTCLHIITHM